MTSAKTAGRLFIACARVLCGGLCPIRQPEVNGNRPPGTVRRRRQTMQSAASIRACRPVSSSVAGRNGFHHAHGRLGGDDTREAKTGLIQEGSVLILSAFLASW